MPYFVRLPVCKTRLHDRSHDARGATAAAKIRSRWRRYPPVILVLAAAPLIALAQPVEDPIEEVVVTADFRANPESRTASSISVVASSVVQSRGAQHFEDVIATVPNLNFAGGTGRTRFFQIRGIGERSQFIDPINPSVGVMIDNIDFSGSASVATLFDVEQVEVLRGPQGTRYGANALAGLINIKTRDPEDTFSGVVNAGLGQYGQRTVGLITTGPLSDATNFRLAVEQHEGDGYYSNSFLGRDDVNQRDELTLRAKLAVTPPSDASRWRSLLTLAHTDIDNGYDAFSLDNTRTTLSDQPGFDEQTSTALGITATRSGDSADLQLLANVASTDSNYGYDEDWTFVGIHPFGYSSFDNYQREKDTASLEARLISNTPLNLVGLSTDWVVGVYMLDSEEALTRDYTFSAPFNSDFGFTNTAVFTQLDTVLNDNLNLSTGLRLERRESNYRDSNAVVFEPTENLWGGKLALQYFHGGSAMSYISAARGYKAGGFNTDGSLDADLREFDSESLVEIEVGYKASVLDDTLTLQAAIFHDWRRNQQVKSSLLRVRDNGSTEFIDFLGNAAEGTNQGVEIETRWQASDHLTLFANLGLLDACFDSFINENGDDLAGRDQAQAPSYSYHAGGTLSLGAWQATLTVDGKDEFFFSDRHSLKSTDYVLANLSVSTGTDAWQVRLWARNLTDKDVTIRGFGSFGNDPRKDYITEPYVQFGEPRVAGVSLEYTL